MLTRSEFASRCHECCVDADRQDEAWDIYMSEEHRSNHQVDELLSFFVVARDVTQA